MLHGFGGSKTSFETTTPAGPAPEEAGGGSTIYRYNNDFYARRGYAVVNYTARGFGNSCGGGTGGDHSGASPTRSASRTASSRLPLPSSPAPANTGLAPDQAVLC